MTLRALAEAAMTAERKWYQENRGSPDHPLPTFVAYGAEQTAYHAACTPPVILALLNERDALLAVADAALGTESECLTREAGHGDCRNHRTLHAALDRLDRLDEVTK